MLFAIGGDLIRDTADAPPGGHEHLLGVDVSTRSWNGVDLCVAEYRFDGEIILPLPYQGCARLGVVLEQSGGTCETRHHANRPCLAEHGPRSMHFTPADLDVWGYTRNARRVVDATLVFDFDILSERLAMEIDSNKIDVPQQRFSNDRIWSLVKLLSDVVDNPDPSMQLYGDGIIAAITSQIFATEQANQFQITGLAPWQLRRVVEYMETHFPQRIELATLAAQINLSQAHFSRAFKASTGLAPYQWQLNARIERAQFMLAASDASLAEIAVATGFADTVHFGRTFRKLIGVAPGAWRSDRKR